MNLSAHSRLVTLADALMTEAGATNERRMLVISGVQTTTRECALALWQHLQSPQRLWVGEEGPAGALTGSRALKVLGSEQQWAVFDAWSGLNPDAFCAVAGTLSGGGLLVVLTPPLSLWPRWHDPDYSRMLPHGYSLEDIGGRFLRRVTDALSTCAAITCRDADETCQTADADIVAASTVSCNDTSALFSSSPALSSLPLSSFPLSSPPSSLPAADALAAQNIHLQGLLEWARTPCAPVVITADRGRGKSALLGRFAAHCQCAGLKIVVTAANPSAAAQVLAWTARETHILQNRQTLQAGPVPGETALPFLAPDALLAHSVSLDILLVDEAAMLPMTVLQQLITQYPRLVLASTVHGYEGSGRGLAIKLFPWLDREKPGWRSMTLTAPMRWREGDPLERWLTETFCLGDDVMAVGNQNATGRVRVVSADELLFHPELLHQVFGLLVAAHYRTTPSDVRDLLDGPNLVLWVLEGEGSILGVCLVALEGPFTDGVLRDEIMAGKRRPRGHLLPQTLAFHCHSPLALSLKCARVVRIAVAPSLQGHGMGTRLLQAVEADLAHTGIVLLGTSFALETPVLRFWQKAGMQVLRVGATRESASGLPACLMAKPLIADNAARLPSSIQDCRDELSRLADQFRQEARDVLRVLVPAWSPETATALLEQASTAAGWVSQASPLSESVAQAMLLARVRRFVAGAIPFESALGALQRWWRSCRDTPGNPAFTVDDKGLHEVLAGELSLGEFARRHQLTGRAAAIRYLRSRFSALLDTHAPSS